MMPAERQRRRRDKIKQAQPAWGSEDDFRLELHRWIHSNLAIRFRSLNRFDVLNLIEQVRGDLAVEFVEEDPEGWRRRQEARAAAGAPLWNHFARALSCLGRSPSFLIGHQGILTAAAPLWGEGDTAIFG